MSQPVKNMKKLFVAVVLAVGIANLRADAPFQASLTPYIAIHSRDTFIRGLSINVWGENPQYGADFGIINGSTGDSGGFSWALLANYDESYQGVQWALVNISKESFAGWQDGVVNLSEGSFKGFQSGWVNFAEDFHGFQLGLVNCTENLNGLQVGLVNVAKNNPWFNEFPNKLATGFPVVNWSF
jgi:hypothetical protein